jgi:hypothetical protein
MTTAQGLAKCIKELKKKVHNERFDRIIEIYDFLMGLETKHKMVWNYLNKGTHEESDLDEFDPILVREIFSKLEQLDNEAKAV